MITLWRGNSFVEIQGAKASLLATLSRHLAVQLASNQIVKCGNRFSYLFKAQDVTGENTVWASLLHGNRAPAGLVPHLQLLLKHYKQAFEYRDTRTRPEDQVPLWSVKKQPRVYQKYIHGLIIEHGVGVIDAPPRSGKTSMMENAIDALNVRTLVVAPSVAIVKQTYESLVDIFGEALVSCIAGDVAIEDRDTSKRIVVATVASAVKLPQEYYDTCDMLLLDEFHHGAAESYHTINTKARNIYYRICFTGTHFRTNEDERMAMEAICSNILAKVPMGYLVQGGWLTPANLMIASPAAPRMSTRGWDEVYLKGIVKNNARNDMIVRLANSFIDNGVPTLVLVRRRAHAKELASRIPDSALVRGGETALTDSSIKAFRTGQLPGLVGTTVIGEGIDLPNAGAVIYASGGGASVQQIQSYFRPLTGQVGKACGYIIDFKDSHQSTLSRHSDDRIGLAERCLETKAVML